MRKNVLFILFALILLCGKAWAYDYLYLPFTGSSLSDAQHYVFACDYAKMEMKERTNGTVTFNNYYSNVVPQGTLPLQVMYYRPGGPAQLIYEHDNTFEVLVGHVETEGATYGTLQFIEWDDSTVQSETLWDISFDNNHNAIIASVDHLGYYIKFSAQYNNFFLTTMGGSSYYNLSVFVRNSFSKVCTSITEFKEQEPDLETKVALLLRVTDSVYVNGYIERTVFIEDVHGNAMRVYAPIASIPQELKQCRGLAGVLVGRRFTATYAQMIFYDTDTEDWFLEFPSSFHRSEPMVFNQALNSGDWTHTSKLIKLENVKFESESLSGGKVGLSKNGVHIGYAVNDFGTFTGKQMPLNATLCDVIGVYTASGTDNGWIMPILVTDIDAGDAPLPTANPGSLSQTTELTTPYQVTLTPTSGITSTYQTDGGTVHNISASTTIDFYQLGAGNHSLAVTASRDFYTPTSGTYNYNIANLAQYSGGLFYRVISESAHTAAVTYPGSTSNPWGSFSKPTGHVVIPATVTLNSATYNVIQVDDHAFEGCTGITQVTIGTNIQTIQGLAFKNCSNIARVNFYATNCTAMKRSDSTFGWVSVFHDSYSTLSTLYISSDVTRIPEYAFSYSSALTTLSGPNSYVGIPSNVNNIGAYAFAYCGFVVLRVNAAQLEDYAFQGCTSLYNLTLDTNVQWVGDAFYQCNNIHILWFEAANCTHMQEDEMESSVFDSSAEVLQYINITEGVTCIPANAFRNMYHALSSTLNELPSTLTTIGENAFRDCSALTTPLNMPEALTSIGDYAFNNGPAITGHVNLPNIVSIGAEVFKGKAITEVTLGANITSIGTDAFTNCSNLTQAHIYSDYPPQCATRFVSSVAIEVPYASFLHYPGQTGHIVGIIGQIYSKLYDYEYHDDNTHYYGVHTEGNNFKVVPPYCFGGSNHAYGLLGYASDAGVCANLPTASVPTGDIRLGGFQFENGSWGDITAIDEQAFYTCMGITGIDFGVEPVESIGRRAFGRTHLSATTLVTLPSTIQSLGAEVFGGGGMYRFTNATPCSTYSTTFGSMSGSYPPEVIYVPRANLAAYKSAWTSYASVIQPWENYDFCKLSDGDMIYYRIIDNVNNLVDVVPPTNGDNPYAYPLHQTKPSGAVTIPATVTNNSVTYTIYSITQNSFKGCSLTSLTLGESLSHIDANAFAGISWQANVNPVIKFTSATCPTISAGYMLPNVAIQVPYDTYFTSYSSSTFTSHLTDADNQMYSVLFDLVLTAGNGLYVPAKQLTSNTARLTAPFYNFNQGYYYGFVGTNTYGLPSYDDIVPDFSYRGNLNLRFMLPDATGQTQNSYIITEVGVDCFRGSSSLQSITFAGSLSSIADGAFSYCNNLHRITLLGETPPTLTSSLPTTIAICVPKTAFENYAWAANWEPKQLYSVNYDVMFDDPSDPNNHYYCVQNPGTSTYTIVPPYLYGRVAYEYKRLGYTPPTDAVAREYMPSASKPSGDLHLKGVNNAVGNITCIGATAFKGCNLTSIDFGEEPIQTIEIGAFESLNGISSDYIITIPATVTSIGNSAFRYYTAKAHMLGTTPPAINEETFGYITSNPHFSVIYVPRESVDAYKTAWPQYESIIQPWECYDFSEVITSYRYFFSVTDAVNHKVELVAPNVTDNPYDGISDKPNWQIDIPATVTHDGVTYTITSIGEYALRGCSINQIYMGANIAYLANHALDGISTLRHVVFRTQNCPTVASGYVLPDLAYQVPRDRLYAGYYTTEWRSHFTDCDGEQYERLWNDYVIANNNTYKVPVQNINDRTAYKAVCPYFNITKGYYYTVTGGNPYHLPNFPTTDYSINYSGVLDLKNIPGNKKILEIGDDLLKGYTAVTGVVLADELTTIADGAFRNSGITEIELPHLVSSIGAGAFSQCQNLSIVKVWSEYTPTAGAGVFDGCTSLGTIYVGHYANVMDPYASKSGWSAYADKIEPLFCDFRIEGIYYGYVDIRNAQNPQTTPREMRVVSPHYNGSPSVALEYYADFEKTTGVVNVMDTVLFRGQRYPVKALNDRCFKSCSGITEVNLPSSVTGLGSTIFHGCTSLTHFEIPNTIEAIPTNTFEGSSVLTVVFPENFEVVTGFQGCHSLNNIVWPTMPARIEGYAFQGCQNLSSDFHVPYNVKRLGTGAFQSTNITNLDFLNDSIYEIGADAFQFCHNLTTAVLPKALVTLQEGCFYECENLQTVVLNEGLVTINSESGGETFRGCNNLHTLVIPSTVRNFNGNPFYRNFYIKDILCKIVDLDNLSISFSDFPADPNDRRIIVPRGMRQAYMDYTNANNYHPLSNLVWNANEQDWCAVEGEFDFVDTYEGNTLYYNVTDADNHTAEVSYIYHDAATRDQEESYYGRFNIIEPKGYVKIPDTVHPCHTNTAYAVTGIGANAFNMVQLAASIDLPLTITNIADGAFNNCGILQYLYARPFTPPTVSNGGAGVIVNQYGSYPWVHVQCGRLTTYYDAWSALQNRVTFVADDLGDYKIFDNNSGIGNHLWSNDANWPCNGIPDGSEAVVYIADNCTIDGDVSAHTLLVDPNKVVTVASGGKLTVDDVVHTDYNQLVLEDGAQLITAKTGLKARVNKNVAPYLDGTLNDKWYFIGSPMATSTGLGTFTATSSEQLYDLYRYDEPSAMWINVKDASNNFTNFSTGVGYLYSQGFSMSHRYFEGELNPTGVYPAAMTLTANNQHGMAGINLVGNPMPCIADLCYADGTAYAGDSYVMNEGRTDLLVQHGAITLGVADAVMMPQFYSNLVVRQHVDSRDVARNVSTVDVQPMLSIDLISNDVVVDRAIVHVGEGQGLEKINLFDDGMELYLMADGSRCATTYVEGEATLTLCLKVREEGSYSLVPSLMGMEGKTLILVDTITGVSTDLNQSKYIFKASPADSVERFQVIVR